MILEKLSNIPDVISLVKPTLGLPNSRAYALSGLHSFFLLSNTKMSLDRMQCLPLSL